MSAYFITAIGTGVGKTLVTAALAHQLTQAKKPVQAIKPIVSGYELGDNDSEILLQACDKLIDEATIAAISPWRFAAPLSPHLAAAQENKSINTQELLKFCTTTINTNDITIIEGVGGLMVPLNADTLVIDWIKALQIPAILVASSYLGAINHTLLSLHALQESGIPLRAIVMSQSGEQDAGLEQTRDSIAAFCHPDMPIITIPRIAEKDKPWKFVPNLLSLVE